MEQQKPKRKKKATKAQKEARKAARAALWADGFADGYALGLKIGGRTLEVWIMLITDRGGNMVDFVLKKTRGEALDWLNEWKEKHPNAHEFIATLSMTELEGAVPDAAADGHLA